MVVHINLKLSFSQTLCNSNSNFGIQLTVPPVMTVTDCDMRALASSMMISFDLDLLCEVSLF